MCDSPQNVYAKCLPNNRGYPLWFPEPSNTLPSSYRQDGLQIGDVGYVDWDGAFNVLFNISYGPCHALRRRPGVSFNFDPIELDADYEIDVNSNADPPGYIITSPGITRPPPKTSQRVGHYEFTPSSAKGAILILPDGATSHKLQLLAYERFRKVAIERAFDWYEKAKSHYGGSIGNDSLYLITGFYKARSWSLASFHEAEGTENRHIWVVPREGQRSGSEWKCTFPLESRDGPEPGHHGSVNQTVFIRGFKIAIRGDVLGWLSQTPEVRPIPAVPHKDPCCFAKFMRKFCKKKTFKPRRMDNEDVGINHVPTLSQPFHPSDIINCYLLNKDPNALVAVTHDDEWMALIEAGELPLEELMQGNRLEEFLWEKYSLVSQPENSAVYLQSKRGHESVSNSVITEASGHKVQQDVLSTSEEWTTGPYTDNFQLDITRIRSEGVIAGFSRMPVGFYVLVQFDGTKWRTKNKPVRLRDDIVEWDEGIELPSERSTKVRLSVYASFEFSPTLGNGEVLRTAEICFRNLLDKTHLITFPTREGEPVSPCSSLHITIDRRPSRKVEGGSDRDGGFEWEEESDLARLTDQGHDAFLRYRTDPSAEILAVSIRYFERALAICSSDHHCYAAVLCNLAGAYFTNRLVDCGSMKLSTSISYYRKALELRSVRHPDRPATLLHLAEVLLYHYGKFGLEEFPGEITRLALEVQGSCLEDSHERRAADLALQTYALYKAISSGSLVDINKLIPELRQAVQDIPRDYFDRVQRMTNLVTALWIRYESCGDLGDLDESIATHEEATLVTPSVHGSRTSAQLLKEREKATFAGYSWKDALVTANSFVVPRFSVYRILCERLETVDRLMDAAECFREMTNELAQETRGEEAKWIPSFKSRCCGKLEELGDIAINAKQYNKAVSQYSVALSLGPATPHSLFLKRSEAYIAKGSWEEALSDANEAITLHPASPGGYKKKYIVLQRAGDYKNAVEAYEVMLLKIAESPDPGIHRSLHNHEAERLAQLENRLRQYLIFLDDLAQHVKNLEVATRLSVESLQQWVITFGAVLGLRPSQSAPYPPAYVVFASLLSSLSDLCNTMESDLQMSFIPLLNKLKAITERPKQLLDEMHILESHTPPSPITRFLLPDTSKNRRRYIYLQTKLLNELPLLLGAMDRAIGLAIRITIQGFLKCVRDEWMGFFKSMVEDDEHYGGIEEISRTWSMAWEDGRQTLMAWEKEYVPRKSAKQDVRPGRSEADLPVAMKWRKSV